MRRAIDLVLEDLKQHLSTDEYSSMIMGLRHYLSDEEKKEFNNAVDVDEKVAIIEDILINRGDK